MSAIMPTYGRLPVTFASGAGAYLTDQKGRQYLDALSGIAVTNLGHSHPSVTRAVTEQAESLLHTSNLYGIAQQERLAAELNQLTGMERIFFATRAQRRTRRPSRWQGAMATIKALPIPRLWS